MSNPDFDITVQKRVHHKGQGEGMVILGYDDEKENRGHQFTIPYTFKHSPNGPKLVLQKEEFKYEGPGSFSSLPEEVAEEASSNETMEEARRKANY